MEAQFKTNVNRTSVINRLKAEAAKKNMTFTTFVDNAKIDSSLFAIGKDNDLMKTKSESQAVDFRFISALKRICERYSLDYDDVVNTRDDGYLFPDFQNDYDPAAFVNSVRSAFHEKHITGSDIDYKMGQPRGTCDGQLMRMVRGHEIADFKSFIRMLKSAFDKMGMSYTFKDVVETSTVKFINDKCDFIEDEDALVEFIDDSFEKCQAGDCSMLIIEDIKKHLHDNYNIKVKSSSIKRTMGKKEFKGSYDKSSVSGVYGECFKLRVKERKLSPASPTAKMVTVESPASLNETKRRGPASAQDKIKLKKFIKENYYSKGAGFWVDLLTITSEVNTTGKLDLSFRTISGMLKDLGYQRRKNWSTIKQQEVLQYYIVRKTSIAQDSDSSNPAPKSEGVKPSTTASMEEFISKNFQKTTDERLTISLKLIGQYAEREGMSIGYKGGFLGTVIRKLGFEVYRDPENRIQVHAMYVGTGAKIHSEPAKINSNANWPIEQKSSSSVKTAVIPDGLDADDKAILDGLMKKHANLYDEFLKSELYTKIKKTKMAIEAFGGKVPDITI